MRCRHQERLWKEYLRNPSLWWDFRKTKTNPGAPDFKHKHTQEPLWLQGFGLGAQSATWFTENSSTPNETKENLTMQSTPMSQSGKEEENDEGITEKMKTVNGTDGVEEKRMAAQKVRPSREVEEKKEKEAGNVEQKNKVHNYNWASLSLQETVTALEKGLLLPSAADMSCILHECRKAKDSSLVLQLHAYARKNGWEAHNMVGNVLVSTLAGVGVMHVAQEVFDILAYRSAPSWNAMLMGYIKCGKPKKALSLYYLMQKDMMGALDGSLFVALIKVCAILRDLVNGCELHGELARIGLLERDQFVGSSLVDMYVECGYIAKAEELFRELKVRDVVTWNALLGGYLKWGHTEKALDFFQQMQMENVVLDGVTFVFTLKACCSMRAIEKGQDVHAEIERKGLLERDLFIASILVDMYAKSGLLIKAKEVLDRLPARDVVCWTALITGYAEHGHGEECFSSFEKMKHEGFSPNIATLLCCLKACGSSGATDKATEMHAEIERRGLLELDHLLGSALVDMYAKGGAIVKAQETFDKLPARNVVSWTALISGYVELGQCEEALSRFDQMHADGVSPDAIAFISSLKACGILGATDKALEIFSEIERQDLLRTDVAVGNALVDMYARCGLLAVAHRVFDHLPARGVVAWNSLIAGYSQLGESEIVFCLFDKMLKDDIKPDLVTFVIVLDVCSQVGLYDKGEDFFKAMSKEYDILPVLEHHTCMLDLLGRMGLLEKGVMLIKKLPVLPDLAVWHTVLGACRKWGNVELGRDAFELAVHLDEKDGAAYVMMASIYANAKMEKEVKKIEAMRVEKQAWKRPRGSRGI